eukprot:479561_1
MQFVEWKHNTISTHSNEHTNSIQDYLRLAMNRDINKNIMYMERNSIAMNTNRNNNIMYANKNYNTINTNSNNTMDRDINTITETNKNNTMDRDRNNIMDRERKNIAMNTNR